MKLTLIFGGQGSQKAGMGREFFAQSAAARAVFNAAEATIKGTSAEATFAEVMFAPNELLGRSDWTQSCVLLNEFMAFAALCEAVGVELDGGDLGGDLGAKNGASAGQNGGENGTKTAPNSNLTGADGANKNIADGANSNLKCDGAGFDGANGAGATATGTNNENSAGATAILPRLARALTAFAGKDVGFTASFGHSLGEFGALGVSGAFGAGAAGLVRGVGLVRERGAAMMRACAGAGAGMLVVLGLTDEAVEAACEAARAGGARVWAANYNCDGQLVVAGVRADLETLAAALKGAGARRAMLLDMSVASHCPLLQSAADEFGAVVDGALAAEFAAVLSNATTEPYTTRAAASELLRAQLVHGVRYKQSVARVASETAAFVEFGTNVLAGINKKITDVPTLSLTSPDDVVGFLEWARGAQ